MRGRHLPDIPALRLRAFNTAEVNSQGKYVLYWMIAARRTRWNFAMQRAAFLAKQQGKPLVVLEALRVGYPWASDRLHRFVIEGMRDNHAACQQRGVLYYPYLEPSPNAGHGLLAALAEHASVVVTDEYPAFFLPKMVAAASEQLQVRLEAVDANGLLPMRAADRDFPTAYAFRRFLQKNLPPHLDDMPVAEPLSPAKRDSSDWPPQPRLGAHIRQHWPAAEIVAKPDREIDLAEFRIDHKVGPAAFAGGPVAAERTWHNFLHHRLGDYDDSRNQPDDDGSSGLSPYLHFGHIGAHQLFHDLMKQEQWSSERLAARAGGMREGWWGASQAAEAFLDQFITWRELGFNMCVQRSDFAEYESLPHWAQATLARHARDKRSPHYTLDELGQADTYDEVWNAAQRQLTRDGRLHNYLRMLWGKKILEWSPTPRDALAVMIELNNKYAVDGRDPNSYSGIFWTLGRYDRPWGPERPIFGTVRYMSSDNTVRKLKLKNYLQKYSEAGA